MRIEIYESRWGWCGHKHRTYNGAALCASKTRDKSLAAAGKAELQFYIDGKCWHDSKLPEKFKTCLEDAMNLEPGSWP